MTFEAKFLVPIHSAQGINDEESFLIAWHIYSNYKTMNKGQWIRSEIFTDKTQLYTPGCISSLLRPSAYQGILIPSQRHSCNSTFKYLMVFCPLWLLLLWFIDRRSAGCERITERGNAGPGSWTPGLLFPSLEAPVIVKEIAWPRLKEICIHIYVRLTVSEAAGGAGAAT